MSFIEQIEDDLDALLREVGLRLDLTQNSTLTTHDFIDRTGTGFSSETVQRLAFRPVPARQDVDSEARRRQRDLPRGHGADPRHDQNEGDHDGSGHAESNVA